MCSLYLASGRSVFDRVSFRINHVLSERARVKPARVRRGRIHPLGRIGVCICTDVQMYTYTYIVVYIHIHTYIYI